MSDDAAERDRPLPSGAGAASPEGRRWLLALGVIVLFGGCLRIAALELAYPTTLSGDELYYVNVAVNIARGRGHLTSNDIPASRFMYGRVRAFRPPAHPFLMSMLLSNDGLENPRDQAALARPMKALQVLVSTILVAVTGLLGASMFEPRVGVLAALLAALDPVQIAYSGFLWSEPLVSLLVCSAVALAALYPRRPGPVLAIATGVLLGLGGLTREIAIPIVVIVVLWWAYMAGAEGRARALRHGAVTLAVAASIVLCWTLRNYQVLDRFVPVATIGAYALAEGNVGLEGQPHLARFKMQYLHTKGELGKMDFARSRAVESIASQIPGWFINKPLAVMRVLLNPINFIYVKLVNRWYGEVSISTARAMIMVSAGFFALLMVAAILGFPLAAERGPRLLIAGILSSALAVHILANASTRFRVPWLPFLCVFAALAIVRAPRLRSLDGRTRAWTGLALLIFIGLGLGTFAIELPDVWMLRVTDTFR